MEERIIKIDLNTAKKWYQGGDESLKTLALQAFSEDELKKKELPNTWGEFCKEYPITNKECFFNSKSEFYEGISHSNRDMYIDRNLLLDKNYAEGILALCQLTQLRDCYRQEWEPNWDNSKEKKYSIVLQYNEIIGIGRWNVQSFLSFQTSEIRDKFLENFRYLIEQAKEYI